MEPRIWTRSAKQPVCTESELVNRLHLILCLDPSVRRTERLTVSSSCQRISITRFSGDQDDPPPVSTRSAVSGQPFCPFCPQIIFSRLPKRKLQSRPFEKGNCSFPRNRMPHSCEVRSETDMYPLWSSDTFFYRPPGLTHTRSNWTPTLLHPDSDLSYASSGVGQRDGTWTG